MESSKSIIRKFDCKKHPGKKIQKVAPSDSPQLLFCKECVLPSKDEQTKESIIPIQEYIQRSVSYFEKNQKENTIEGDPPADLLAVLDSEDETVSKLSAYIEAEKLKVENSFAEITQMLNTICMKSKQEIFTNLDKQLHKLRFNYRYYKDKLNKFYGKQTEKELSELTTEKGIITAINKCESSADLEFLIKQINNEMNENKFYNSYDDRSEGMKHVLKELSNTIQSQKHILPKTQFSDQERSQKSMAEFQKAMNAAIDKIGYLDCEISQVSFNSATRINSTIFKNSDDVEMTKAWLSSDPPSLRFNLLIRGTRDGFDAQTFHKKCDNIKNTLVLIKTNFGKTCGGFTEVAWSCYGGYREQSNSFLFSIDQKAKFPLKKAWQKYSICVDTSYLPTFGGGHDLHLADLANTSQNNYSSFGHSFETGVCSTCNFTGAYNFTIEEYEVFEIVGYRSPKNDNESDEHPMADLFSDERHAFPNFFDEL